MPISCPCKAFAKLRKRQRGGAESTAGSAVCPQVNDPIPLSLSFLYEWEVRLTAHPPQMSILKGKNDTALNVLNYEILSGISVPFVAFLQTRDLQPVSDERVSLIIQC